MLFSKMCTKVLSMSHPYAQKTVTRSNVGQYFRRNNSNTFGQSSTRSFGPNLPINPNGPVDASALWKPIIFTATFSAGTFAAVSIWEYENLAASRISRNSVEWFRNRLQNQQRNVESVKKTVQGWWNSLSVGEKLFVPICALNLVVFAMWRLPRLQPFMMQYFCSNPAAKAVCWPMVLSTFSHYSMFHIFANMYVLHSFANAAAISLGPEQLLGVYLSAGVISSLASYLFKASVGVGGMSLGASGAIMGVLAYVCSRYPDTQLGIMFLPMLSFSAGSAIKVMIGVDLAGCLLRWRFFDHAAHLGGALVGIFWCYIGSQTIWPKRIYVQQYWHQLRTQLK